MADNEKERVKNAPGYRKIGLKMLIILIAAVILVTVFLLMNPPESLELPPASDILSMDMEYFTDRKASGEISVTDASQIETVISALSGARKTIIQSVHDYPIQSNYLVIRLNLQDDRRTLCLYSEGSRYYMEEPYIGVYKSSQAASDIIYKLYTGMDK